MLDNIINENIEFKAKDGSKLAATIRGKNGSGKGAIVLPGFFANREAYFDIADSLDDYLCFILSLRGQGSKGEFDLTKTVGDIDLAQQILGKEYNVKSKGVVAHSGSTISSVIAANKGYGIDSLCLVSAVDKFSEPDGNLLNSIFKFLFNAVGFLPKGISRKIINPLNYPVSRISPNYRNLSFKIYKEKINKKEDIFLMGLKISDTKKFVRNCLEAPIARDYAKDLEVPVLYLYGGNDFLLGFKNNDMPDEYKKLVESAGAEKNNKNIYCAVIDGADHQLNKLTLPDDSLNYSPELRYVRKLMKDFLDASSEGRRINICLNPREPKLIFDYTK